MFRRAEEARIIPTCKWIAPAIAVALTAIPVPASSNATGSEALTYVQARAASMRGEHRRSAQLLAGLADSNASDLTINRKALAEAIGAGDMPLALRLARKLPESELAVDARLLLVADELRNRRADRAIRLLGGTEPESTLGFIEPLLRAWGAAERRDLTGALNAIDTIPVNSLLGPFRFENRAFILLKFRRPADAEPFARRAIGSAGGREARLRLALADAFLAAGDRQRAVAMVQGMGTETGAARERIQSGKPTGQAIESAAQAFAEVLLGLAVDLNRLNNRALPVGMVQVARYADPQNSAASVLLALLFESQDRSSEALRILAGIPSSDALAPQARDAAARILIDSKRVPEAYALAREMASRPGAGVSDFARLGDVLQSMERYQDPADAYGRAIALTAAQGLTTEQWPLHLLRATALESADRWDEAKQALQAGLAIAPEQPLILNFYGYAKLERGEDLDSAEAMIRKASALDPENASITDSLGWALFKRGRLADAIETLQRAALRDPQQWEIHEHLGDALYTMGRRYEARFAWSAALTTAEDDVAPRLRMKLESGLTPANAAP